VSTTSITASDYANGNSERLVTQGLKGVPRDKVIVVSKTPARTRGVFMSDLEASLKNLATDRIDIWLLHGKSKPEEVPDELLEAGSQAKKQGKIRFFGVSTHDLNLMADHFVKAGNIDAVTFTFNFTMGAGKDAAIAKLSKAGNRLDSHESHGRVRRRAAQNAQRRGEPPPTALDNALPALKWVLRHPEVATTIPGVRDMEMLELNIRALSEKLTAEDEKRLVARSEAIRPYYCRMCYSCRGQCPKGMPVQDQLSHPGVRGFLQGFPPGPEEFCRPAERGEGPALLGLRGVLGALPQRRQGGRPAHPRPGTAGLDAARTPKHSPRLASHTATQGGSQWI